MHFYTLSSEKSKSMFKKNIFKILAIVFFLLAGAVYNSNRTILKKVNGQSPNQGCSNIKVKDGDSSEWSYLDN